MNFKEFLMKKLLQKRNQRRRQKMSVSHRTVFWANKYCNEPLEDPKEGPLAGVDCEKEIKLMEDSKSTLSATNRKILLALMEARRFKQAGIET